MTTAQGPLREPSYRVGVYRHLLHVPHQREVSHRGRVVELKVGNQVRRLVGCGSPPTVSRCKGAWNHAQGSTKLGSLYVGPMRVVAMEHIEGA